MLFSSNTFLFGFLPAVVVLYYLCPRRCRNVLLLVSSLIFYGWGEPKYVLLMLVSILLNYFCGLAAGKRQTQQSSVRGVLIVGVVLNLGMLGFFKYGKFFFGSAFPDIPLPIGISFYIFQAMSYLIDVCRREVEVQKNVLTFGTYVTLFPQLIAGPIVRYRDVAEMLESRRENLPQFSRGVQRFVVGLSKKVLLANVLYELISAYKSAANVSVLFVWLYAAAYVLHLYFDFSGYSDMAIGLGRIFGFHFIENFNYPYISASVTEFWRRWHMSLGSWFRDYVYIPLGGNRVSKAKWFRNIFIVWLLTGLWHGAAWTFILWGLFFAVFLTAEKLWYGEALAQTRFLKHLYVLLLIAVSFVIFDAASVSDAFRTIGSLFGLGGLPRSDVLARYYFDSYSGVFLVAIVGATPLPAKIVRQFSEDDPGKKIMSVVEPVVLLGLLTVVTAYLVDGSFNPFLYFRF